MLSKLEKISDLDEDSVVVYAYLRSFEQWLREMVYVELKAKKGRNWINFNKTKSSYESDKKYTYMPTPESSPLSYLSFSELQKIIINNWELFSLYLPPKNIWEVKTEEIVNIRNRVAHFRKLHKNDLNRVIQFLRDVDQGFWKFCASYNDTFHILPQSKDAVTKKYVEYNPFSPKKTGDGTWVSLGHASPDLVYIVSVKINRRPWCEYNEVVDGTAGHLYNVNITIRNQRQYNYKDFLEKSKKLHHHFVHIILARHSDTIRVTIPSFYGSEKVISIVDELMEITSYTIGPALRDISIDNTEVQDLADSWPEHVLGPKNPLTFLDPEMDCSFFNV